MTRVCFVCLGNICRSPTAEGVFRHIVNQRGLSDRFQIDSAGTAAYHVGEPPDERATQAAKARGITLTGRARKFTRADYDRFDHILVMDGTNLEDVLSLAPDEKAEGRVKLLRHYDPEAAPGAAVPDPYYGGRSGFDDVLDICLRSCEGLLTAIDEART